MTVKSITFLIIWSMHIGDQNKVAEIPLKQIVKE